MPRYPNGTGGDPLSPTDGDKQGGKFFAVPVFDLQGSQAGVNLFIEFIFYVFSNPAVVFFDL